MQSFTSHKMSSKESLKSSVEVTKLDKDGKILIFESPPTKTHLKVGSSADRSKFNRFLPPKAWRRIERRKSNALYTFNIHR